MLVPTAPLRPQRRSSIKPKGVVPPLLIAPTLVAATYESETALTLTFDRAVTVTAGSLANVRVFDGSHGKTYGGGSFQVQSPVRVRVSLGYVGTFGGGEVKMSIVGPSGIAAADGGLAWAGVTDLGLPFGQLASE